MAIRDHNSQFDLISTWGDDCGIFEYAHALLRVPALGDGLAQVFARTTANASSTVHAKLNGEIAIHRCWTGQAGQQDELSGRLLKSRSHSLWMQYHPAFFDSSALDDIAQIFPKTAYQKRVLTVHNVEGLANTSFIDAFTDIVVHNDRCLDDFSLAAGTNIHVVPHFIYSRSEFERKPLNAKFTLATVGFAAQNKRVPLLIDAFSIAHGLNREMQFDILTSPLPTHSAHFEMSRIVASIRNSSAGDAIQADLAPKAMPNLLSSLSKAHVLCMPYDDTTESASGAARLGLSAGVPVLRSNSSIFSDLPGGDFVLENTKPHTIAEALLMLSQMPGLLQEKRAEIDQIYDQQSAETIADQLKHLLA